MESGTEDRSRLRRHVRAAREWLGRAEDSLDRAEDVRGDLNLMLARAELARAQETERPTSSVTWARRLAPLCAAALLAGIGLSAWRGTTESPPPVVRQHVEEAAVGISHRSQETIPIPAIPQADAAPAKEMQESVAESFPAEQESREAYAEIVVPIQEASEPPEAALEPAGARLPSEEMQRLMNSAGQSLRATNIN